jgi:hypothetical protein
VQNRRRRATVRRKSSARATVPSSESTRFEPEWEGRAAALIAFSKV